MKIKTELSKQQLEQAIKGIQGIAHPIRLLILYTLAKEEKTVGELVELLGTSQSAASQHLSKMKNNGILESRKSSNQVFYRLKDAKFKDLIQTIVKVYKK
ncbi:biofilm growth-associated repressor family protein [Leptospira yanagawae serovar Saopaulo str. Sao Paulo = ATCC 700523]|uniref:ArsR family transcriptional regulator n=4 Tax=Leptospira TaxID=171 RepID=A0A7I0HQR2_9LEPT|nr:MULTISPECIES: metalloregulator ArsR/SmtB family transcription factor [Leptospira]TGK48538.1 ArsR family transcriptional regulator [Leptospira bouyouniensis]EOQ87931.1 biofilm growth-associated repressor family protein [Leptospira yanagawae serovar Saopaulo str. Sao Paulo = ATCC 700523]TGL04510.1 ArsR family transcriptional regulator [Leptospira bouyouniensis]TGL16474.1 ArsR family transcriptional regulator [Leptospira yanagawae]TGL76606.1 ArsR family transcriptional regulator [Leptospira je